MGPTDRDITRLLSEARAKLTWGAPADEVRGWLREKGVPEAESEPVVQRTLAELTAAARTRGGIDVLVGAALVAFSAYAFRSWQFADSAYGGALVLLPGFGGAALLWRGGLRLTSSR